MSDNKDNKKKPLRPTSNKVKDLYNAYLKNEGSRRIPVSFSKAQEQEKSDNDIVEDKEINNTQVEIEETQVEEVPEKFYEELMEKIKQLESERDDLKDQLIRKAAEFENLRRRTIKEKQELIDYANERLITSLLPLMDDFSKALEAAKTNADFDSLRQGIEMIYNNANKILSEAGVKQMDSSVGKPFNVDYHDALMSIPSEFPEGYVVQEFQPGYMLRDKVIRHAKVVISSGEPEANKGDQNNE
ncbi:MAG: nucleotide exchange factor GrpE [Candidatus Kapabacteria bacterium]|nr:nucleotide exchange factor GrpE [Candidatus Kapabacteria bacterium]